MSKEKKNERINGKKAHRQTRRQEIGETSNN